MIVEPVHLTVKPVDCGVGDRVVARRENRLDGGALARALAGETAPATD